VSPARLALFLPSLAGGGAERVMVTLANGFAARGHRVDLVLAHRQGSYLSAVSPQVTMQDLAASGVLGAVRPLAAYLRRERPAALLSAQSHANAAALIAAWLARGHTRVVVSERSTISVEAARAQGLRARALYAAVPRLYRRADGIVAVSDGVARDLEAFAALADGSVRTIYNPADLASIRAKACDPPDHPWFDDATRPVVVAVGRLAEQKGFETLIAAFASLSGERAARLMILGEGPLRPQLERCAAGLNLSPERFQMPGFVINPHAYVARAAVFVLSSHWEGLPNALIEAMACGAPVVSTDCPSGPREILDGGRWGRLVPVGDRETLADAIDAVLRTPRAHLPDVRRRAEDFDLVHAIDAYLEALGAGRDRA